ncbi:MAG TPA: amidase, partial [Gammaproteobacteria bacterium]|nr:amidase [Gammaproteobacteria bacterium]
MSDELWQLSACDVAQGIRDQRFTSEAVVASVTERMAAHNPRLNAIVLNLGDEALMQARAADASVKAGAPLGPLHGVPVTIKSNIDVKGQPTPNGLPAFADLIAQDDSP